MNATEITVGALIQQAYARAYVFCRNMGCNNDQAVYLASCASWLLMVRAIRRLHGAGS